MKHYRILCILLLLGCSFNLSLECTFSKLISAVYAYNQQQAQPQVRLTDHQQEQLDAITDRLEPQIIARLPIINSNTTSPEPDEDDAYPYSHQTDFSISIEELIANTYSGFRNLVSTIISYLEQ